MLISAYTTIYMTGIAGNSQVAIFTTDIGLLPHLGLEVLAANFRVGGCAATTSSRHPAGTQQAPSYAQLRPATPSLAVSNEPAAFCQSRSHPRSPGSCTRWSRPRLTVWAPPLSAAFPVVSQPRRARANHSPNHIAVRSPWSPGQARPGLHVADCGVWLRGLDAVSSFANRTGLDLSPETLIPLGLIPSSGVAVRCSTLIYLRP